MVTRAQGELKTLTWQNSSRKWKEETQLCLGTVPAPVMLSRDQSTQPTSVPQDLISMYDFCKATWSQLHEQVILYNANPGHRPRLIMSTHLCSSSRLIKMVPLRFTTAWTILSLKFLLLPPPPPHSNGYISLFYSKLETDLICSLCTWEYVFLDASVCGEERAQPSLVASSLRRPCVSWGLNGTFTH